MTKLTTSIVTAKRASWPSCRDFGPGKRMIIENPRPAERVPTQLVFPSFPAGAFLPRGGPTTALSTKGGHIE